jgi:hypothetical protein
MNAAEVAGAIIKQCNHGGNLAGSRAGRNNHFFNDPRFRC